MSRKPRHAEIPPWFGHRLKRERERRSWTLRDVSGKSGVATATVLRMENGNDASLSTVVAVTSALGLSIDALTAETECAACDGAPPEGFICSECRREGTS